MAYWLAWFRCLSQSGRRVRLSHYYSWGIPGVLGHSGVAGYMAITGAQGYIIVDNHEPAKADTLIASHGLAVFREPANEYGLADYTYLSYHANREMVERKQIGELFSEGLIHIEVQLKKELQNCAKLYLVIEGILEPRGKGVLQWSKNRGQWQARLVDVPYNSRMQWETNINDFGITIVHTTGIDATVQWLVGRFNQAQEPNHQTMSRVPKGFTEQKHHDLRVQGLMGLAPGIGPVTAGRLLVKYGSIADAIAAFDLWHGDGIVDEPLSRKLARLLLSSSPLEEL